MAIPFELRRKAPPELAGALDIGAPRPDAELFHVQVLGFGRCLHCDRPFVIQALDRAAQCAGCNRRYVFARLELIDTSDGKEFNIVVSALPADEDHPIRVLTSN